jgi:glycine cleavage system aminomethyltransferase T
LRHPLALAMLKAGRQRMGERLIAYHMGQPVAVEVVHHAVLRSGWRRLNG